MREWVISKSLSLSANTHVIKDCYELWYSKTMSQF